MTNENGVPFWVLKRRVKVSRRSDKKPPPRKSVASIVFYRVNIN